nr:leucyl/phenylalanyl-tRNA--protein transferase [Nitratireductor sp.]
MSRAKDAQFEITPQVLLKAYACGIFPMAESAHDPGLFWVEPEKRGIIPLDGFHVPRSLKKVLKRRPFEIRIDHDFEAVIDACAE